MNQVNFDYWLEDVAININGAEIPLILSQIRLSAIEFCEKSLAWTYDSLPINVTANDGTYNLEPETEDSEIVQVVSLQFNGKTLDSNTFAEIESNDPSYLNKVGYPKYFVQEYVEKVVLWPKPAATGVINCKIALRPTRIARGMNGSVAKRYFDAISDGAKSRLLQMSAKPWTDVAKGMMHEKAFKAAYEHAKIEVYNGLSRRPKRTRLW